MTTKKLAEKPPQIIETLPDEPSREITVGEIRALEEVDPRLKTILNQAQYDRLMTSPPPYAILIRPDGMRYLPHGYVTNEMNAIFGQDWDFELLSIDGKPYEYISAEEANMPTKNPCIVVHGQLTVRIWQANGNGQLHLVTTITKHGIGGSEVRKKMERADAVKAAASDARKVCASQLGPRLGLTLYWNDEARQETWEASQKQKQVDEEAEKYREQIEKLRAEGKDDEEIAESLSIKYAQVKAVK